MRPVYKTPEGQRAVEDRYRWFLERWPVPSRQLHVPTCEGETFVIASGPEDAPPLVLLHGAAFNSVTWMGDVAEWASAFRVYAVDVIGHPNLSAPARPEYGSDAYARWLDDVLGALGVARASFVGMSLGGWLALDYATRRPGRVSSLVLVCPGGVGREKLGTLKLLFVILPLLALGDPGRRCAMRLLLGPTPSDASPEAEAVGELMRLVFRHFQQNLAKLPPFDDRTLRRVTAPALLIVGARDAMLDSADTRRRLESTLPRLEVRWLPDTGHTILAQTRPIAEFLSRAHQGWHAAAG